MRSRGYSLIETMIVLVIIGAVLGVTLPAFGTYRAGLTRSAARQQLVQDLRLARQMAITQRTPVVVAFGDGAATTDLESYSIHADRNGDRLAQTGELRKLRRMPAGTRLARVELQPTDSLVFDLSGVLWPGTSGGRLILRASLGRPETLVVSMAGMVHRP
jgi:prepilin-type N-terminal cleavage/methylation domain-containing protein